MGAARDLHLGLARSHRLHEHEVHAEGIEDLHGVERREGEPAGVAARRHRPDEHARIGACVRHSDPIPEHRAAGEGRRRVHGDDADPLAAFPELPHQAVDQ